MCSDHTDVPAKLGNYQNMDLNVVTLSAFTEKKQQKQIPDDGVQVSNVLNFSVALLVSAHREEQEQADSCDPAVRDINKAKRNGRG